MAIPPVKANIVETPSSAVADAVKPNRYEQFHEQLNRHKQKLYDDERAIDERKKSEYMRHVHRRCC
jgi:hypothetical protein